MTPRGSAASCPADPDDALVEQVRSGDQDAFARFYRHLTPGLRRYAVSLVGQDADDVLGEAWLQIARDIGGFTGTLDDARGWAARIVRNRALDLLRHRARRPVAFTPIEEMFDLPDRADTEAQAVESLTSAAAVELIASLPRPQAEAIMLRVVVGLDSSAAGAVLGRTPTAVRVAAHRGLKKLARILESQEVKRDAALER